MFEVFFLCGFNGELQAIFKLLPVGELSQSVVMSLEMDLSVFSGGFTNNEY